jgi:hypothetical protein
VTTVLKQKFLTKYIALLSAGTELLNKKSLKGISSLGLVVGLVRLESVKNAIKACQSIMMNQFVASA